MEKADMICAWLPHDDLPTYIDPRAFVHATVRGVFGDQKARVVRLERRGEKARCGVCDTLAHGIYDRKLRRVFFCACVLPEI